MKMIKIYNSNPEFGDAGPFEVESVESFIDEMRRESFPGWALEKYQGYIANFDSNDGEPMEKAEFIANEVEEMAIDFEDGLEVVGVVVNGYDMSQLNGDYSVAELVSLRDRNIAWNGDRNVEAEEAIKVLCDDALNQIGADGMAMGVTIENGGIVNFLIEDDEQCLTA